MEPLNNSNQNHNDAINTFEESNVFIISAVCGQM